MNTSTSGHLSHNGGIRGHSAGEFYPFRVMAQGNNTFMTWWVVNPQGKQVQEFNDVYAASEYARLLHSIHLDPIVGIDPINCY